MTINESSGLTKYKLLLVAQGKDRRTLGQTREAWQRGQAGDMRELTVDKGKWGTMPKTALLTYACAL